MTDEIIEGLMDFDELLQFPEDQTPEETPEEPEETPAEDPEPEEPEEEETPEEEPAPKKKETPAKEESSEEEGISTLEFLQQQGLLVLPDDFDFEDPEAQDKAAQYTREAYRNEAFASLWGALDPQSQEAFQYVLSGGGTLEEYLRDYSTPLEDLKMETVDEQRKIMTQYYKSTTKYSDEKIEQRLNKLEDADILAESAQEALEELKELRAEKLEALNNKAEADRAEARKNVEEFIGNVNAAITSQIKDSKRQSKIKGFFFNELRYQDGSTGSEFDHLIRNIRSNPEHLVQLADIILDSYDIKKGFSNERFVAQGKTQANKSIKNILERQIDPKSKVKGAVSESKPTETVDLEKFFNY